MTKRRSDETKLEPQPVTHTKKEGNVQRRRKILQAATKVQHEINKTNRKDRTEQILGDGRKRFNDSKITTKCAWEDIVPRQKKGKLKKNLNITPGKR